MLDAGLTGLVVITGQTVHGGATLTRDGSVGGGSVGAGSAGVVGKAEVFLAAGAEVRSCSSAALAAGIAVGAEEGGCAGELGVVAGSTGVVEQTEASCAGHAAAGGGVAGEAASAGLASALTVGAEGVGTTGTADGAVDLEAGAAALA